MCCVCNYFLYALLSLMSLGLSYPNWHLFLALPCILFYTALVARRLNDIRGLSMAKYIWGIFWIWVIISYPFRTAAGIYADVICGTLLLHSCFCQGENDASDKQIRLHKNFFAISVFFFLSFILMIMGLLSPNSPLFLKLFFPYLRFCKTATPCLGDGKYIYCDSILGNCEEFF